MSTISTPPKRVFGVSDFFAEHIQKGLDAGATEVHTPAINTQANLAALRQAFEKVLKEWAQNRDITEKMLVKIPVPQQGETLHVKFPTGSSAEHKPLKEKE